MIASREQLERLAEDMSKHLGWKLSTIGTYGVNDGKIFDRWSRGGGCTLRTSKAFLAWFSDNWPEELSWPEDIPRPTGTLAHRAQKRRVA